MSAKRNELARIQEIYDVATQTLSQMEELGFTEERFLEPKGAEDDLIAEGILNRVLRVTEEAGHIEDGVARQYGFDRRGAVDVRNRLAHAYGEVDREIIWQVLTEDFKVLISACHAYCDDQGLELE